MDEANDIIPRSAWLTLAVTSIAAFMIAIETSTVNNKQSDSCFVQKFSMPERDWMNDP